MTILCAARHETERGDHDSCLSRSRYTHTDPTSRKRAATSGIELRTPQQKSRALPTELPPPLKFSENRATMSFSLQTTKVG